MLSYIQWIYMNELYSEYKNGKCVSFHEHFFLFPLTFHFFFLQFHLLLIILLKSLTSFFRYNYKVFLYDFLVFFSSLLPTLVDLMDYIKTELNLMDIC
jgi:hypothetical protein